MLWFSSSFLGILLGPEHCISRRIQCSSQVLAPICISKAHTCCFCLDSAMGCCQGLPQMRNAFFPPVCLALNCFGWECGVLYFPTWQLCHTNQHLHFHFSVDVDIVTNLFCKVEVGRVPPTESYSKKKVYRCIKTNHSSNFSRCFRFEKIELQLNITR